MSVSIPPPQKPRPKVLSAFSGWVATEAKRLSKPLQKQSFAFGISVLLGFGVPFMMALQAYVAAYSFLFASCFVVGLWWWNSIHAKTQTKSGRRYSYQPNRRRQIVGATSIVVLYALCMEPLGSWRMRLLSQETHGFLRPLSKGTATKPIAEWGSSGVWGSFSQAQPSLEFLRDNGIKVEIENGVPLLTTTIRDREGHQLVKVMRNEWWVNESKSEVFDKNYTKDRLEVLDGNGHVAFQVQVLPDRIRMFAQLHDEHGNGLRIAPTPNGMVPGGVIFIPETGMANPLDRDATQIPSFFKYPSSENLGNQR